MPGEWALYRSDTGGTSSGQQLTKRHSNTRQKRKKMKITVIAVGKIKEKYLKDALAEYSKRLSRYCKLEIIEVAD